ncbi:MAG: MerR family transcriptional regulator [Alphaproteobacteria bacterium]|nr:MerR family transcriptional regulator [Alphaproteobacteria bacterium]MCZ6606418.1 MerR family transcriptional regulator [Alphaproteobacteria bacterium]
MTEAVEKKNLSLRGGKSAEAFRTISEAAGELDLPQHVLRFWETKFPHIRPLKRGGGRRYYRPEDLLLLRRIRDLLYDDGYTIRGVQKLLRRNDGKTPGNDDDSQREGIVLDKRQQAELADMLGELEELRDLLRAAPKD